MTNNTYVIKNKAGRYYNAGDYTSYTGTKLEPNTGPHAQPAYWTVSIHYATKMNEDQLSYYMSILSQSRYWDLLEPTAIIYEEN